MFQYEMIMPSIKNRSVLSDSKENFNFRIEVARDQAKKKPVDKGSIIGYVNEFFKLLGMEPVDDPYVHPKATEKRRINYYEINPESKEDIVWIKFNTDGHISVVGTSCDISFSDYAKEHTAAGIINKALNKEWDEKEVLVFPLKGMPQNLFRSDIESGVGNYLISKQVPILDYYSHNY